MDISRIRPCRLSGWWYRRHRYPSAILHLSSRCLRLAGSKGNIRYAGVTAATEQKIPIAVPELGLPARRLVIIGLAAHKTVVDRRRTVVADPNRKSQRGTDVQESGVRLVHEDAP